MATDQCSGGTTYYCAHNGTYSSTVITELIADHSAQSSPCTRTDRTAFCRPARGTSCSDKSASEKNCAQCFLNSTHDSVVYFC